MMVTYHRPHVPYVPYQNVSYMQLGQTESTGAMTAGKLFGAAVGGAFEGAIIGAVAAGKGSRGHGALLGAGAGAALLLALTALGIVSLD